MITFLKRVRGVLSKIKNFGIENVRFMRQRNAWNQQESCDFLHTDDNEIERLYKDSERFSTTFAVLLYIKEETDMAMASVEMAFRQAYDKKKVYAVDATGVYQKQIEAYAKQYRMEAAYEYISVTGSTEGDHAVGTSERLGAISASRSVIEIMNQIIDRTQEDYILFATEAEAYNPCTLWSMARRIAETNADLLYTDAWDKDGKFWFKPDFAIDTLRSSGYIGNAICIKRQTWIKQGGMDAQYVAAFVLDFILRTYEKCGKIEHIAKPLTLTGELRHDVQEEIMVLEKHLSRMGLKGQVQSIPQESEWTPSESQ